MATIPVKYDDLFLNGDEYMRVEADETIAFSLDGDNYLIDVTTENGKRMREALAEFIAASRRGGRASVLAPKNTPSNRSGFSSEELAAIREWARGNGFPDIADRGRVAADVITAWQNRVTTAVATAIDEGLRDGATDEEIGEEVSGILDSPPSAREALDELEQARQAKQRATADPFTAEPSKGTPNRDDITDTMIIAYRESKGLPVKLRKGQVPATYREAYYTAHGITG